MSRGHTLHGARTWYAFYGAQPDNSITAFPFLHLSKRSALCLCFCIYGMAASWSCDTCVLMQRVPSKRMIVSPVRDSSMAGYPRTTIESHHCVIDGICYCPYRNRQIRIRLFIDRDSCSSSWLQICSVAQDDLEVLIFLPLPLQCWDWRHTSPWLVYVVLGL